MEHAIKYITDGTIDIDNVLTAMADAGDSKIRFKLPKVLNKATGKNTSTTFNFSWPNWGVDSLAYRDSIAKRDPTWLCDIVKAAQRAHKLKIAASSSAVTACDPMEAANPRGFLCK